MKEYELIFLSDVFVEVRGCERYLFSRVGNSVCKKSPDAAIWENVTAQCTIQKNI